MNRLSQDARRRQAVVELANKKGKSKAVEKYGVSLSSVKRWCKRYDGTWQSLKERSHRPHSHPNQHTPAEENAIRKAFSKMYFRYGWDGVYDELVKHHGYKRSYSGMYHAGKRIGMGGKSKSKKPPRVSLRRYPEILVPGEKVQIDVKEAPYYYIKGKAKRDGKRLYQWTAIDECTRLRFIYAYEDHTPENSIDFWCRLKKAFPFPIQKVQTDNGTEFTYRFISDEKPCPFEETLANQSVAHILIPPRTPWKNGKVERSHRNDQRYFYNHEMFSDVDELNFKLKSHLLWSNNKYMRVLGRLSPFQKLNQLLGHII